MSEAIETTGGKGVVEPAPATRQSELPYQQRSEFTAIADQCRKRIPFHETDYHLCRNKLITTLEKCNHPRNIAMLTRVLGMLERMNQVDQHHLERLRHESGMLDLRYRRADEGKPSEIIGIQIAPSEELPLPPALADYRLKGLLPAPGKN